jgi:hypothetical protein
VSLAPPPFSPILVCPIPLSNLNTTRLIGTLSAQTYVGDCQKFPGYTRKSLTEHELFDAKKPLIAQLKAARRFSTELDSPTSAPPLTLKDEGGGVTQDQLEA